MFTWLAFPGEIDVITYTHVCVYMWLWYTDVHTSQLFLDKHTMTIPWPSPDQCSPGGTIQCSGQPCKFRLLVSLSIIPRHGQTQNVSYHGTKSGAHEPTCRVNKGYYMNMMMGNAPIPFLNKSNLSGISISKPINRTHKSTHHKPHLVYQYEMI